MHSFKAQLPELDGIENIRVGTIHGVLNYKRPGQDQSAATLNIGLSAYYLHTDQHRRSLLALDVPADATAPWISEQLANRGIDAGWNCVRPDLESWRVNSLLDGGRVTGVSIELASAADWALVVELDDGEG